MGKAGGPNETVTAICADDVNDIAIMNKANNNARLCNMKRIRFLLNSPFARCSFAAAGLPDGDAPGEGSTPTANDPLQRTSGGSFETVSFQSFYSLVKNAQ
jgi:hypothetical protein